MLALLGSSISVAAGALGLMTDRIIARLRKGDGDPSTKPSQTALPPAPPPIGPSADGSGAFTRMVTHDEMSARVGGVFKKMDETIDKLEAKLATKGDVEALSKRVDEMGEANREMRKSIEGRLDGLTNALLDHINLNGASTTRRR